MHHPRVYRPIFRVAVRLSPSRRGHSVGVVRKLLLLTAIAAGVAATPAHAAGTRQCGLTPRIDGVKYQVDVEKGTVSCKTARGVASTFLRKGVIASPWHCLRGHESQGQDWAASCSRGKNLVRVWAPS
jgi:hypothetical protein